jgi:uncharacterized protein YndB with AHSA1/START domain
MKNRIERQAELNAPISRVWRALTDYQEFGEWFGVSLEGPFQVGEVLRGHMTEPGYEHVKWESVVKKMEPEKLFSYTWHPYAIDPKIDYSGETPTLVEFKLEKIPNGTRLWITETGFDQVPAARREEAFEKHEHGWTIQMQDIQKHVEKKAEKVSN